jgi:hypothetical protein
VAPQPSAAATAAALWQRLVGSLMSCMRIQPASKLRRASV